MAEAPIQRLPGVLGREACTRWIERIDQCIAALPADHPDMQPTSGSLRLRALGAFAWVGLLQEVTPQALAERLGWDGPAACLTAQCWARIQHPPAQRPAGQHPHQWHQDGALHCRFDRSDEALAPMRTLWIALTDCGIDAPSLEWTEEPTPKRLEPQALRATPARRRHAVLRAGDALLFDGTLLHRTFVTPTMTRRRASVELRFVPAAGGPARLAAEPRLPATQRCPP